MKCDLGKYAACGLPVVAHGLLRLRASAYAPRRERA